MLDTVDQAQAPCSASKRLMQSHSCCQVPELKETKICRGQSALQGSCCSWRVTCSDGQSRFEYVWMEKSGSTKCKLTTNSVCTFNPWIEEFLLGKWLPWTSIITLFTALVQEKPGLKRLFLGTVGWQQVTLIRWGNAVLPPAASPLLQSARCLMLLSRVRAGRLLHGRKSSVHAFSLVSERWGLHR